MDDRRRSGTLAPRVIALAQALADVMLPATIERAGPPAAQERRSSDDKLLLRIGEAAERLSISRTKVYELVSSGEIPTVRIGRSVRVPTDALREWIRRESA